MNQSPPRILHIITGLGTGGAEASLFRVIRGTRDPLQHAVVSLTTRGTFADDLEAIGVRVSALGLARGQVSWSALHSLRTIARHERPDVIQGWMYHASLAASILSLTSRERWPVLWNVRHALDAWDSESPKLRWLIQLMARFSAQPRAVVYNSSRSAKQHEARGYATARTVVIHNGVDTDRLSPDLATRAATRQALGIPADAVVIGKIARVDPIKDHETFLRVAANLVKHDETVHFLLAGTGTEAGATAQPSRMDAVIAQLTSEVPALAGRLWRCGERRDIAAIYNACDIVMLTSRAEGSPNAVAEAMSCGVPAIVTDVGDAGQLVGASGIVAPVGDVVALATAALNLARETSRRNALGKAARARIQMHYSASHERSSYERLWATTTAGAVPVATPKRLAVEPRLLVVTTVSTTLDAFLLPYADHYRKRGWQVEALAAGATTHPGLKAHFDRLHDAPWERRVQGLKHAWRALRAMCRAPQQIRELVAVGGYDLVHVHTPIAAWITRFALRNRDKNTKVIYTAHGFHAYPGANRLRNAAFRSIERVAARWMDYLIVINRDDLALALRDRLASPDRIVQHSGIGVDTTHYRVASAQERRTIRESIGLDEVQPLVVVVAEFTKNKRQDDVIEAISVLSRRGSIVPTVLFLGDGPRLAAVEALAVARGVIQHVRFLGHRKDVASFVASADALLLPSQREGLPRCLLEAMAMRVPVIASDARGSRELVADGRGISYRTGDVTALAHVLTDQLQQSSEARQRAERAADWIEREAALPHLLAQHDVLYDAALRGLRLGDGPHPSDDRMDMKGDTDSEGEAA